MTPDMEQAMTLKGILKGPTTLLSPDIRDESSESVR